MGRENARLALLRSQPEVEVSGRKLFKCIRLSIALRYNLGNRIQTFLLVSLAYSELHFDKKNRNGAKCFEEVFSATPQPAMIVSGSFLNKKVNCFTTWLKICGLQ